MVTNSLHKNTRASCEMYRATDQGKVDLRDGSAHASITLDSVLGKYTLSCT